MSISTYIDQIVEKYGQDDFYNEVTEAREEYFKRVGRVADASESFEGHMTAFLDWYIFDRVLKVSEVPPATLFYQTIKDSKNVSEVEKKIFKDISENNHSMFEFIAIKKGDVYVRDLFDKETYLIEDSDINVGFSKGDIFEARLIKYGDQLVFGNSFIFHPTSCKKFIVKEIKKIKNLDAVHKIKLLHKFAVLKLKSEQYPHVEVKDIYSEVLSFEAH